MRIALLLAAGCVFGLPQPSFAIDRIAIDLKFSKPNISYNAFLRDRNACLNAASRQGTRTLMGAGYLGWYAGGTAVGSYGTAGVPDITYSFSRFGKCMVAKGYTLNPNGFHAATFVRVAGDCYHLLRA